MKLSEMAKIVNLECLRDAPADSLGKLVELDQKNLVSFIESPKYLHDLLANKTITAVFTKKEMVEQIPNHYGIILSEQPGVDFIRLHNYLIDHTSFYGEQKPSFVDPSARIAKNVYIDDHNVFIGKNVYIEPSVTIMANTTIKDNTIIRAGVTIGTEGFEFRRVGEHVMSFRHAGGVVIEQNVEIQANCSISKSIFRFNTVLGEETKLDNLVHIAHQVRTGKRCLIAACAMLAGRINLGDDVWIGPGAVISSQVNIGDKAKITLGSVVTRDVEAGQTVTGHWAVGHDDFKRGFKNTYLRKV